MSTANLSDEELEKAWKAGSSPAFATLFERYHRRVYGFLLRFTRDAHLAEDLAQRAFLNLYKKPPSGTGKARFKSLLFTVARNEAINELKKRGRRGETDLDSAPEGRDHGPSPEADVTKREEAARLAVALADLPEGEREVVLLRQVEGLTFREVCEVTGLSRDAVRWRLARGLESLRLALTGTVS
ncbi:MAG: RNA polymerase sigma factor [Planctomycetes bacterium]|nr:RNA polymerase sigma factor [Planctomycetota bacterium]